MVLPRVLVVDPDTSPHPRRVMTVTPGADKVRTERVMKGSPDMPTVRIHAVDEADTFPVLAPTAS